MALETLTWLRKRHLLVLMLGAWGLPGAAQPLKVGIAEVMQRFAPAFEKVLRSEGFVPEFVSYPGERALMMLGTGELDADFARTQTAVQPIADRVTLAGPVACVEGIVFSRRSDNVRIRDWQDLRAYKIGIPAESKAVVDFLRMKGIQGELVSKRENAYAMLARARFDLLIDSRVSGGLVVQAKQLEGQVVETGPVLFAEPVYFAVSNKHKDWAPRIQRAFTRAIRNGSWQLDISAINMARGLPRNLALTCLKR